MIHVSQHGGGKSRGKDTYCEHLPDRDALEVGRAFDAVFCVFVTVPYFGAFDKDGFDELGEYLVELYRAVSVQSIQNCVVHILEGLNLFTRQSKSILQKKTLTVDLALRKKSQSGVRTAQVRIRSQMTLTRCPLLLSNQPTHPGNDKSPG